MPKLVELSRHGQFENHLRTCLVQIMTYCVLFKGSIKGLQAINYQQNH